MKIVIANSKNWFVLNDKIKNIHDVYYFKCKRSFTLEKIKSISPDIIFFPHWNHKVEKQIFENFDCIVFHTAPLPYGRGGSPIQNLILNGFTKSPVCALKMVEEMDSGPIYMKKVVSLKGSLETIFKRINKAINKIIEEIITFRPQPIPQTGDIFKFKRKTSKENALPKNSDLKEVFDRIRMLDDPNYPNAYIEYGNFRFEFSKASLSKDNIKVTCRIYKC